MHFFRICMRHLPPQIGLYMKLLILFLCLGLLHVSAKTYGQYVSLSVKDTPLETVIQQLRGQTGYDFVADRKLVRRAGNVNVQLHQATLEQALNACLKGKSIAYRISGGIVTLVPEKTGAHQSGISPAPPISYLQQGISGKVTDSLGNPLAGVTIVVRGSSQGSSTDDDGHFLLPAKPGDIVDFRLVGYQSQSVTIGGSTTLDIILQPEASDLDEVVVVAYGTQKKETVTGAIASIRTKEIKQSPAANLAVTLAGRLPGLTAIQRSGEPGRDYTALFLRGQGTLNGQNPIILVDGVERDLTYIDPNEVESVTILKDASSTALFGVRGANGVVLVTTRRGSSSAPQINFTAEVGMQDFTRKNSVLNAYDWARLKNEAWKNDNPGVAADDPVNKPPYSDYALERYRLQDDPLRYPSNNWRELLMNDFVPQNRYNLNISGGSNRIQYFVNVGYLDQAGQWKVDQKDYDPSSYLKRYNFRSNIDAALNRAQTLKTFLNVAGYLEKVNSPFQNTIFRYINNQFPSILPGPLTPDGEVIIGSGLYNTSPYAMINRSGYTQGTNNNILASWGMQQDLDVLTEGLSAKFMMSFDTRTVYQLNASRNYETWTQIMDPNLQTHDGRDSVYYTKVAGENTPLSMASGATFESFSNFQFLLNYNRSFGDHHVTGLLMGQQEQRIRPGDRLPFNLRGISSRLTYGYKNLYFAEFNAGYNGSEQFAKGQRYGFFPSVSGSWVISSERFMQDVHFMDLLKLRASYGQVGNDRLGSKRFLYLDDIQRAGGGYSPSLGVGATISESYIGNPNIKWEIADKVNLGLELGLFRQLNLTVDVFSEKRSNVLISRGMVPMITGIAEGVRPPANMGIVENKGYEIELKYNKRFANSLSIFSNLNFNRAANKVVFMDEPMLSDDYAYRYRQTGYPIGQHFGYVADGFFGSQEEIDQYAPYAIGRNPRPGDLKYVDVNNDGVINDRDIAPIGHSMVPTYTYGAALGISYKGFSVSALFQGVAGVSMYLSDIGVYETYDFRARMLQAWTPERHASGAEILYPALSTGLSSSNTNNSFYLENTSFVRLKNAEVGYEFSGNWVSQIRAQSIRIYVNGMNLFTWDQMRTKDYDPEISNSFTYPVYRVFNAGINIIY